MGYKTKYTNSAILRKIVEIRGIDLTSPSMGFSYRLFKKTMMDERMEPIICYDRSIKQKYQDLIDCDYISDSEESPRLNLDAVRECLALAKVDE